MVSTLAHNFAS